MSQIDVTLARIAEIQQRFEPAGNVPTKSAASGSGSFSGVLASMTDKAINPDINNDGDTENITLGNAFSPQRARLESLIQQRASLQGIDPNLVKAVVQTESNFNPKAVSAVGAQGLMQLMPGTANGLGVKNSFDPTQNVDGGIKYLKGLINKYQSLPKAVAAYNAGPGAVDKFNGIPPYAETRHYTEKVLSLYEQYKYSQQNTRQPKVSESRASEAGVRHS